MGKVWMTVLKYLAIHGFPDALKIKDTEMLPSSGHEVIDALRKFVKQTGYVNAHAGLTSSDVIDNVRLIQCDESARVIESKLKSLLETVKRFAQLSDVPCIGYTHWRPASATSMKQRFMSITEPLAFALHQIPDIRQKRIGGAIGNGKAIEILTGGGAHVVDIILHNFRGQDTGLVLDWGFAMQSSYHYDELRQAQWLELIVAQLHKIAQDVRFLCHTGELAMVKEDGYRGSSAMPGKENPVVWEQICSLARLQPNYTRAIWDAMAFNGLERTLDTSASLRVTLPAMYDNVAYLLTKMTDEFDHIIVDEQCCKELMELHHDEATVEYKMANRIAAGESRAEVYEKLSNE